MPGKLIIDPGAARAQLAATCRESIKALETSGSIEEFSLAHGAMLVAVALSLFLLFAPLQRRKPP
jgi:hypothetical protein